MATGAEEAGVTSTDVGFGGDWTILITRAAAAKTRIKMMNPVAADLDRLAVTAVFAMQQFLNFFPLPHGHNAFLSADVFIQTLLTQTNYPTTGNRKWIGLPDHG